MQKHAPTPILKEFVREVMRVTKTNNSAELGRAIGIHPSTLWRILASEEETMAPKAETLRALQAAARRPLPPELAELLRGPAPEPPTSLAASGLASRPIPVHALIGTRIPGRFHLNREPFEYVRRPEHLLGRERVFALRMPDDSMMPWRAPNELILVDPTWAVAQGDHALVEINNTQEPDGPPLYIVRRFIALDPRSRQLRLGRYGARGVEQEALRQTDSPGMQRILEWPAVLGYT